MSDLLTTSEVSELVEGTPVTITWSGGNGPHDYVIAVDERGRRHAAPNNDPDDPMRWYNPITFVGLESFHTHVRMADGKPLETP
jgi:hypothetical protein